jgi:hypothetical protein
VGGEAAAADGWVGGADGIWGGGPGSRTVLDSYSMNGTVQQSAKA